MSEPATPFEPLVVERVSKQRFVKYYAEVLAWRKHLSAIDWTVLSVINDKIYGWGKEFDAVSTSQILDETKLSIRSIKESLARMILPGQPLEVVGRGKRNIPIFRILPCNRHMAHPSLRPTVRLAHLCCSPATVHLAHPY